MSQKLYVGNLPYQVDETQLQQVNEQVNSVESQILQTKTLISYATINVTIDQTAQQTLPTMTLSASPRTGAAPLSVTFNALAKGGGPRRKPSGLEAGRHVP